MLHHRCLLEVVGWLSARDVALSAAVVSSEWNRVTDEDELWLTLAEASSLILTSASPTSEFPGETNKHAYQRLMEARFFLPITTSEQITYFHVHSQKRTVRPLSERITADFNSFSLFLSDGALLVCGGGASRSPLATAYRISRNGLVGRLPDMNEGRRSPGVVLYCNEAFVFGGYNLVTCEKLDPESPQPTWTKLPKMSSTKSEFTPCVHLSLIYLCGGGSDGVIFDPALKEFKDIRLKCRERNFAIVIGEELVVITTSEMKTFNLATLRDKVEPHSQWGYGGICTHPVLHNLCLWVTFNKAVLRFDLTTLSTDIFE